MKKVLFVTAFLSVALAISVACASAPATVPPSSASSASAASALETATSQGARVFVIDAGKSEARFIINEVLNGAPNTVVGRTNRVQGSIAASYDHPSAATMTPLTVDLSGLATDSAMRNRMIQGTILETGNPAFQIAEFDMTKLEGMPDKVTIGQPFDFKITGKLTLHGVTKEVTFDATVTPVSDTQLTGRASLQIAYADFGVGVFRMPPQVASVANTTILEIDFVAIAQ